MKGLTQEEVNEVLGKSRGRGRPAADASHPLGFLRTVRDQLGPPPYDPQALLDLAKGEPGFYNVVKHPVLQHDKLVERELREYAAIACSEVHEVTYQDADGHWLYDDAETCDLERGADHLRFRRETDRARKENYDRIANVLEQRAIQEGKTLDALLAEADSRFNVNHDQVHDFAVVEEEAS